ncbi:uncharacterized protein LOC121879066 [Homarus americanus]|uniref:uncharacterized protein LOC121879066 n=1 Tax=Homarus americanus TaxID=6706 RepID=UPI001C46E578|nr:uncharacterized protein LOC121879066 [Homarus americanus]XP_042241491.1 uncharacterized protein LOC121879066 [Homarus americanus]XP_042241492.1 uncharacterized protein LOC121879066 [Homarus americanus]
MGPTTRLGMVVVMVLALLQGTQAAPGYLQSPGNDEFTTIINEILTFILNSVDDPLNLKDPLNLRIDAPYMADVTLYMEKTTLAGVKSFTAHDCTYDDAGNDKKSVVLKFQSPQLKIKTPAYVINGTVVDHIDLHGKGPASFIIDDFDLSVAVKGIINISGKVITMVVDSAIIDLEMRRWTVDFEGLMPESDLGEVFNEFFSEHGPELFDILEDKINKSGKLVEFLNSLFPPKTSAATLHSDVEP